MDNIFGTIFSNLKPGKKTGGFALVVAAGAALGAPITLTNEGMRLAPYCDTAGVLTVCNGETEHVENRKYSEDECINRFEIQYGYYSFATARFYTAKAQAVLTPQVHAAMTDMSYNVGLATVQKSFMMHKLNDGDAAGACASILEYKKAGGKDCSIRANGCFGIWDRRVKINKLCMEGLENGHGI